MSPRQHFVDLAAPPIAVLLAASLVFPVLAACGGKTSHRDSDAPSATSPSGQDASPQTLAHGGGAATDPAHDLLLIVTLRPDGNLADGVPLETLTHPVLVLVRGHRQSEGDYLSCRDLAQQDIVDRVDLARLTTPPYPLKVTLHRKTSELTTLGTSDTCFVARVCDLAGTSLGTATCSDLAKNATPSNDQFNFIDYDSFADPGSYGEAAVRFRTTDPQYRH